MSSSSDPRGNDPELPVAATRPLRRWSWFWLLPVLAAAAALALAYLSWDERGIPVIVDFQHGHGLKEGDALRYRGIEVGRVRRVWLGTDFNTIRVEVRLDATARDVARGGSRFWIVRPEVGPAGAAGLETLIGANYLSVLPGRGTPQTHFRGLESAPILETMEPGGIEVLLRAARKGNLRPGARLDYRQVMIGKILSVSLAPDASSVQARAYVEPTYRHLVREQTRFWKSSGARIDGDLFKGLSLQIESVQTLLTGGVTLALPPDSGATVASGHAFALHEEPRREWLDWTPNIALQQHTDGPAKRPQPLFVRLLWEKDSYLTAWGKAQREGWILPVQGGFLGPANLLTPPADAEPGSLRLITDERELPIHDEAEVRFAGVAFLTYEHSEPAWANDGFRGPSSPEDSLIVTAPATPARYVAASSYESSADQWRIVADGAPALAFTQDWNGAPVVAISDGAVIGVLVVNDGVASVAPLRDPSTR
jgi:hypothetical protein